MNDVYELSVMRNKNGLFLKGSMAHIISYTSYLKDSHTGSTKLIDILPHSPITFYDKAHKSEFYVAHTPKVIPNSNSKNQIPEVM